MTAGQGTVEQETGGAEDELAGFSDDPRRRTVGESLGEALLGSLLDRTHLLPPRFVGPLVAQELTAVGGRDVTVHLQDFDQVTLRPLGGSRLVGDPVPIAGSWAGRAFSTGLVADMIVTKDAYTDTFAHSRTAQPMTLPAQLQRQLLPPLAMKTPDVELPGVLEPAYDVGGDSFDYALDEHVLHLAVIDAMGHGLEAATMATVVIAAYRHARRRDVSLVDLYAQMDRAVAAQFPGRFATAQFGELDTVAGELTWVNAGHPAALLVRGNRVVTELTGPTTRPVGFSGAVPQVQSVRLEPGDRVVFFTDGVVEERLDGGEQFGERRLRELVEATTAERLGAAETVRRLSHALMAARQGRTSDDASLLVVQWNGPPQDDELARLRSGDEVSRGG